MKTILAIAILSVFIFSCGSENNDPTPPPAAAEFTLTGFSPTAGAVGTVVTLTGTNFSTTPANNVVKFNGVVTTVTSATSTSLTVTAPVGGTTGKVTVEVGNDIVTSANNFTFNTPPVSNLSITSFSPPTGTTGTSVTIVGTSFSVCHGQQQSRKSQRLQLRRRDRRGVVPFLLIDPVAFYEDTVKFGAGTYKVVGYGLSGILVRAGIVADRDGAYPFAPFALVLWLPLTVWLGLVAHRAREQWVAPAGYAISILVLLWIGRTFNNYYLLWPMMGAAIAVLVWAGERERRLSARPPRRRPSPRGAPCARPSSSSRWSPARRCGRGRSGRCGPGRPRSDSRTCPRG